MPEKKLFRKYRLHLIVFCSFLLTALFLYAGRATIRVIRRSKMTAASIASSRETDGAENRVVMYGDSGYVGHSGVFVKYLQDGYVHIYGKSRSENYQWKKLADFTLEPGNYSLTGLTNVPENTVQLQLDYPDGESYTWYFLWDKDIRFTLNESREAELYVRIFPGVEVNATARPAVYREK